MSPLLEAKAARVEVDDVAAIIDLTLVTTGRRLVLAGHASPLVCALTGIPEGVGAAAQDAATLNELTRTPGRARATSGELRLAGHDVVAGEHLAYVGAAPLDPPLPADWTVESYVIETARLGLVAREERVSRYEVTRRATDALTRLGLAAARKKAVRALHPAERRVLVLAAAVASGPTVLVADRPLAGLEGQSALFVHGALEAAASDRPAVISVAQVAPGSLEGSFARSASDLGALVSGELSLFGPPAEVLASGRIYRLTVRSNADALRAALEREGASFSGGPTHFSLRLAEGQDASAVLRLASELRAAVMELVPVL